MHFHNLKIKIENKIVTIVLNHPKKLNILSKNLLLELREYLSTLKKLTKDIRGMVLIGAGNKAFSTGGDIKLMNELDQQGGEELSNLAQSVTLIIENLPIPVIACVDGFALGGGCELAMSCDFIYATKTSQFGQPEVKIGLIPGFGGNIRLMRLVGPTMARELLYTGRQILAEEAQRIGLINQVFNTRQELLNATTSTMNEISRNSQYSIATAKKLSQSITSQPTKTALTLEKKAYGGLFDHSDKTEGIQAFLKKRLPNF